LTSDLANSNYEQVFPKWGLFLLIPMKVVSDSDLIPVAGSDAMVVTVGAKRRWRSYRA
jgi:hypothetical protein